MKKDKEYLIIGNSAAAIGAVEAIRQKDKKGTITLISDEPYLAYSRPLISYLLAGQVSEERMFYRDKSFYEKNKVEALLGEEVIGISPPQNMVKLNSGKEVPFARLLIATGGKPIIPEVKGKDLKGTFTFTTWDDAKKIKSFIEKNKIKEAVVIGGGLIGLKAAEALIELGIKVAIVELADRILSATFDRAASAIIEEALQETHCQLITRNTAKEIKGKGGKVSGIVLKDRKKLPADLVILAIGVTPHVAIVKDTGIKVNRGILVDSRMRTNLPGIYAAGDVAEAHDLLLNLTRPIPIWPHAYKQGSVAGYNMAGLDKEYQGSFAMNSVEVCGIPTISVGLADPLPDGYEILQDGDPARRQYKKIVLKDNRIVGAIFINDIDRAGIITGLIRDEVDVSSFKGHLMKEDFGLISLPKEYRKYLVTGAGIEV
jgi:NAD(P)H-nitrite reductase large subunit